MQGRKDKKWAEAVDRALHRESNGKGSPKWLDVLANKLVEEAYKGDVSALKEIGDRVDGKPVAITELSGPGGGPVQTEEVGSGAAKLAGFLDGIAKRSAEAGDPDAG